MDTRLVIKNATALGISSILAKAISAVVGIFVTRYLGPGPFGDYSTAYAFVGTFILFSELGISQLMVQEGSRNAAVLPRYFGNTLFFKGILTIICFIFMLIFMIPAGYNTTVQKMIVILGIAVCINALIQSVYNYYQAIQKMYQAAAFQFLTTVLIGGLTMLVILCGWSVVAISFTHFLSYLIIGIMIFFALRGTVKPQIDLKNLGGMVRNGLPFGIHRIFYYIFFQLSILVLSLTSTNVEVGIYSAAYKLMLMLIFIPSLMTSALYPVLYQLGESNKDQHRNTIEKVFKVLSAVGIAGSVLIFVLAAPLTKWLYAGKFNESIPILMIVTWFLALECMSFSLGDVLTTTNRQWQRTLIQGSALLILLVLILAFYPSLGVYSAAYSLVIVEGYIFFGYYYLVRKQVYKVRVWRQLPVILLAAAAMAGVAWLLRTWHPLLASALAGIVYCLLLVVLDNDFKKLGTYALGQTLRLFKLKK
ncbi:MAG TPA: flippase [Peptococcaceae bacterium]|nr:flippase [Peptococcaceae bacterium]